MLDALVVGAGPAGNQTALKLAQAGRDVAVVDYRTNLGEKLCTGIIGRECFEAWSVPREMVLHEAHSARFLTGDMSQILIDRKTPQAYVIDRVRFVSSIADKAIAAGAEYVTNAVVTSIEVPPAEVRITFRQHDQQHVLRARCVVIASGAGSRLAEMAGLSPARKLAYGSQAIVESQTESEVSVLLPGLLPNGHFGWLVSQGDGTALLGVLGRPHTGNAAELALQAAQQAGIAGSKLSDWQHWPVPVGPAPNTVGDRAVLVGDVAGQVKPTTGGGIYYSLLAANLAAETINNGLRVDDLSARFLESYENAWKSVLGRELRIGRIARSIFERLDGPSIEKLLRVAETSGLLDEEASFDWHSRLIVRGLANRMFDAALTPIRAMSGALSAIV